MHFCARCSILSYTRCNSAVSILTAELHRVYDNMLQRVQNCTDVQGDHFQHLLWPVSTLHLHLFNSLYRVRDLRPRWSTRRWPGFSWAIRYIYIYIYTYIHIYTYIYIHRVIQKFLRNFRTRLRNNQERHGRKEHINR